MPGTIARMSATRSASNAMRAVHSIAADARVRSARTVSIPTDCSMLGDRSRTTRASIAPSSAPSGGACGLHVGHTDSGKPCAAQKSPASSYCVTSPGLHLVHFDSGSACSMHQSATGPSGGLCGLHTGHADSG